MKAVFAMEESFPIYKSYYTYCDITNATDFVFLTISNINIRIIPHNIRVDVMTKYMLSEQMYIIIIIALTTPILVLYYTLYLQV